MKIHSNVIEWFNVPSRQCAYGFVQDRLSFVVRMPQGKNEPAATIVLHSLFWNHVSPVDDMQTGKLEAQRELSGLQGRSLTPKFAL